MAMAGNKSRIVARRLYRSLMRACRPFTAPSPDAVTLNCLLHRTGVDDDSPLLSDPSIREGAIPPDVDAQNIPEELKQEILQNRARDLRFSYTERDDSQSVSLRDVVLPESQQSLDRRLFQSLLRDVMAGSTEGPTKMLFPVQVDATRLRAVVRREFRDASESLSAGFAPDTRQKVAFHALRELNKKLSFFDSMKRDETVRRQDQSRPRKRRHPLAAHVVPLDRMNPGSYLRPGSFLLSHPYMHGSFFGRTVVCILDHNGASGNDEALNKLSGAAAPTYGIIVNRYSMYGGLERPYTLREAINALPESLEDVIGDAVVRDGGPVHTAIQMLHRISSDDDNEDWSPGGSLLTDLYRTADVTETDDSDGDGKAKTEAPAQVSDKAVYFQGNILKAAQALRTGNLDRNDVAFFAGASSWSPGQLESEVRSGYWLPCAAPVDLAVSALQGEAGQPKEDLWMSLMSAYGSEEAKLASLFDVSRSFDWRTANGLPCDDFD